MEVEQSASLISDLNLDSADQISEFFLNSLSWARFAEAYFRNPDDPDEPLVLELGQKKAINALQFGYDIDEVPSNYQISNPPKIVVMIWPRQTGKTTAVAVAVAVVLCLQPEVKIGLMGMSEISAKNLINRIQAFLRHSPFKKQVERFLKMEIQMKHGGFCMAHTTSEGIRGQSYHLLLIDEAAQVEDEIIEGAAIDTLRKIGQRGVLLSTPKGYRGVLVKYYTQGLRTRPVICKKCLTEYTQKSFPGVAAFDAMTMPPLPKCEVCGSEEGYFYGVGDYTVISIDPFSCSFYSKEEILAELNRRGNTPLARQELLGEIIPEGQAVFRKEWLDAAQDERLQNIMKFDPNAQYMVGVDFGKIHDNSVIAVGHADKKTDQMILDYLEVIPADIHGKEYEDIKNRLIEIIAFYKPIWVIPDSTGMGEPVVEIMEKDLRQIGWRGRIYCNKSNRLGFIFDIKSKPDLIENLVEYFARSKIKMPPEYEPHIDTFINEALNFSYDMTQANYIKYGVQLEHDDTVIAVALLVWGHRSKPWISLAVKFAEPRGSLY